MSPSWQWDIAGPEQAGSLLPVYFRGALGVFLCYDMTSEGSWERLITEWLPQLNRNLEDNRHCVIFVLGMKDDLVADENGRAVPVREVKRFCKCHDFYFMHCSAKTGHHVEDAVSNMAELVFRRQQESELVGMYLPGRDVWRRRVEQPFKRGARARGKERKRSLARMNSNKASRGNDDWLNTCGMQ
jgi:Ras-related protein Rab-11A